MVLCGWQSALGSPAPQTAEAQSPPVEAKPKQALPGGDSEHDVTPADTTSERENGLNPSLLTHIAGDQWAIWSSPAKLRPSDAAWFVPVAGVAATLFATDASFSHSLSSSPGRLSTSNSVSNYGLASMGAAAAGLYVWGKWHSNDRMKETAILSGEAALNSLIVAETLKYAAGRDRPLQGGGGGRFFQGGTSFPSEHSTAAWSIAGVIAHEYPGPLTSMLAYGLATTISVARVTAKEHFPSDVFVGAVLGWWIARHTYRAHHDFTLGGKDWQTYGESHQEGPHRSYSPGSPFVPLESWIYPAFERLAAMGFIPVANFAIKPWTRFECVRLLNDADVQIRNAVQRGLPANGEAVRLEMALRKEFSREWEVLAGNSNANLQLDSVYAGATSISGPPLTDGFHFGQTVSYDYGRPYERGTNAFAGAEVSGTVGPFAFFLQPEYQHAPGAPPLSLAARTVISDVDHLPLQPATPIAEVNTFDLLQGYVSYTWRDFQLSAGREAISWGPSTNAPLLFGNNARPFPLVRLTQMKPPELPGILKYIYPARIDTIFGRLDGHTVFPRPFIFGQKATLEWGPYFEFSYAHTSILSGEGGDPLNWTSFAEILFGRSCTIPSCAGKGSPPGESNSSSDMTFRVPHTNGMLLFYVDLYSEDDSFAWRALKEAVYRPGLYFAYLPGLPKMDLRIEAANSQTPFLVARFPNNPGFNYTDFLYSNGFTNDGFLMGNTVGRNGQTLQATTTYWFSPRKSLQVSYRNNMVDAAFIPGGGKWQDYSIQYEALHSSGLYLKGSFQFEHISKYPLLFPGSVNNVTAALEVGFKPVGGVSWPKRGARNDQGSVSGSN